MKNIVSLFLGLLLLAACSNSPKPSKMQAMKAIQKSADNSPVRFKLVSSKFERCEKAPDNVSPKGFRKVFTFKSETELELTGEMTPDEACKKRYNEEELDVMQGRIVAAGTYEQKSALEGTFRFQGDVPELAGQGAYKVSGMSLKVSPSVDLSNPDIYIYFE